MIDDRNSAGCNSTSSSVAAVIRCTPRISSRPLTRSASFVTVVSVREGNSVGPSVPHNLARPEPQALASAIEALAARFGNRLVTSKAVRDQHAHTTTWLAPQPPDAVVMAQETADIQDVVRMCAAHRA